MKIDINKKKCFVIMPFSTTYSTDEKDWTLIYDEIIRPSVESFDSFTCKRLQPTRGNMMKEIINELNDSDLVIADLTDHNPNVCYELGIRHGLRVGTILLAQKRKFLNIFDLSTYASHIYQWKSKANRKTAIKKIQKLITGYLSDPQKLDNPPQDFLSIKPNSSKPTVAQTKDFLEYDSTGKPSITLNKKQLTGKLAVGLILLGNAVPGLNMSELVEQISKNWKKIKPSCISSIITVNSTWFIKEGKRGKYIYRLTNKGKKEIFDTVKSILD